jgi:hypothetical protein
MVPEVENAVSVENIERTKIKKIKQRGGRDTSFRKNNLYYYITRKNCTIYQKYII